MDSWKAVARLLAPVVLLLSPLPPGAGAATRADAASWQQTELSLPRAWQITQGNAIVAVVDTGVQADHPALAGHVLPGWSFIDSGPNTADDNGHGTALASIILATCPGCRILPVKVLGADLTGTWEAIAQGVRWAADNGAQVINLSVGSPGDTRSLAAAVSYALSRGSIVVAAAGNDGRDERFYPAVYPGVVSVAGVDQNGARYVWSNFGSQFSLAAPGCTTAAWLGGGWKADFCGTSTAAPFVSGVAGLARSVDPVLSPAEFSSLAAASSEPLQDGPIAAAGLVDAGKLLASLPAQSHPVPPGSMLSGGPLSRPRARGAAKRNHRPRRWVRRVRPAGIEQPCK